MILSESYNKLFTEFSSSTSIRHLEDYPVDIVSLPFHSDSEGILSSNPPIMYEEENSFFPYKDSEIKENQDFLYHIFLPRGNQKREKAILLMHGLNEKSWKKYLPWALDLTLKTGSPVILFPFAFHMDRAPLDWSHPRKMSPLLKKRKDSINELNMSSFANVALSQRLDSFPHRFYISGYQTAMDLISLLHTVRNGDHPYLKEDTHIDLFAYSIGAFLAQILLIADKNQLLKESKIMLFCGGSVFQEMVGESKYIMDSSAFSKLLDYFMNNLEKDLKQNKPYTSLLKDSDLGMAFRSMIGLNLNRDIREFAFKEHADKIKIIGLKKDTVIPAEKIKTTVLGKNNSIPSDISVLDFPFEYTHETPFPLGNKNQDQLVNLEFNNIFNTAAEFLS